ncbi:hypothetical protein AB6A40_010703 [Gnathostoma spinigerum]|uniref:Alpha-carbonic anhydrase domain-containing protein n=1 Tax=Gnathostoma spinigerum TaxID=75299 RepID=A0ABD6F0C1_9BILA
MRDDEELTDDASPSNREEKKKVEKTGVQKVAEKTKHSHSFGYGNEDGPHRWTGKCQSGSRQSPIDIVSSAVTPMYYHPLKLDFLDVPGRINLTNDGNTSKFNM